MANGQRSTTPDAHADIWRAAAAYIDAHLGQRISVQDVAHAAVTSRRQLQRVFAAMGRTTVRAYVNAARMRRAAVLVVFSDAPLATIANEVGYGHVTSFINAFRRHHGCTPGDMRREWRPRVAHGRSRTVK